MASSTKAPKRRATRKYIRNLHSVSLSLRLESKKRFELKGRGQRGDCAPITKEQIDDPNLMENVGLTVEIISEAEALDTIKKQTINQQSVSPLMQQLRSEYGDVYNQQEVELTSPEGEATGVTVAHLDHDGVTLVRGPATRQEKRSVGPRIENAPGSDPEMKNLLRGDDAAKSGTDLASGLGGRKVSE